MNPDSLLSTDEVDVKGTIYKVVLLADMVDSDNQEGGLDVQARVIYLDLDLDAPQARSEVLIHEIVHAYALKEGDASEEQVIKITSCLVEFLSHNPELVVDIIRMSSGPFLKRLGLKLSLTKAK